MERLANQNIKLSIVIPAYNESMRLIREKTLENYSDYFSKIYGKDFEIIVVLNGCKDNTLDVVKGIACRFKRIKYFDIKEAIGKGGAIIEGFKIAKGDLIGFVDADMATKPDAFYDLIRNINNNSVVSYGGAIASRRIKGAVIEPARHFGRDFTSKLFNTFVNVLFCLRFKDTQCGAKLFKKDVCKAVLDDIILKRWAFDVDLLYSMKRRGFKIIEVPTVWSEKTGSKLTWKVPYEMFLNLMKLRIYHLFR